MTKVELLAALATKFLSVEAEQDISSQQELDAGYNHFLVGVWASTGVDGIVRRNINFYVTDLGGPAEAAYWQGGEPNPDPVASFDSDLQAFIAARIADDTIEAAFIDKQGINSAEATVWIDAAGTLEHRTVLFDYDGVGDIQFRILGGAA